MPREELGGETSGCQIEQSVDELILLANISAAAAIANGRYATVTALDWQNIEVKFDNGRALSMPLNDARKVDLGYASTSHAEGSTVDRVLVNIDSRRSPDLVNKRQAYVSLSRARIDARIYTNDVHAMRRAVTREQNEELALDVVQQQYRQSVTIRI